MKQLHFTKQARGNLYICDEGNYRFQIYRTSLVDGVETWAAGVHARETRRRSKSNGALDHSFHKSKAEAIDWCSRRNGLLLNAASSKAEQRKAGKA